MHDNKYRIDKKSCWETVHRLTHNSVRDVIQRIYRGKVMQMRGVVLQMMQMDHKGRPRLCIWSKATLCALITPGPITFCRRVECWMVVYPR